MKLGDTGVEFEQLIELARRDPERFEQVRSLLLERAIMVLPEARRSRIRCLQWRIDQTRSLSRNEHSANLTISNMMWDSLVRLREALSGEMPPPQRAPVIPLYARDTQPK